MADLAHLTITKASELLRSAQTTSVELTQYYLDRISQLDPKIQATLTICADQALAAAAKIDARIAAGESLGPLAGITYTAKDMFLTAGVRTTAASKILENFVPPNSATVIEKLDEAGAILLAKVNQDEFGHGGSTENSAYHPTHNPWDLEHVPGGSSGGSAATVASDLTVFSIGTDTGGSLRQPASFCGVVGLKPTYGLVSRSGVVAMASSLDTIGCITRSVEDAAIVLELIAGQDSRDATSIRIDDYGFSQASDDLTGKKIGIITECLEGLDEANRQIFDAAIQTLRDQGAEVSEVSLPKIKLALPAYYIITPSEISSNLSRYDGIRYGHSDIKAADLVQVYSNSRDQGFGAEAKRRIMLGTYALSAGYYEAYYKKAMQVRTLIAADFAKAFETYDLLISPTAPSPAFKLGEKTTNPVAMYLEDVMTVPASLAGIPAISIPDGEIDDLPTGLQIMAPQRDEKNLLAAAQAYQGATKWHERVPSI